MGYSIPCRNCHQIFYIDKLKGDGDEKENYTCPHCGASNLVNSYSHRLKEMSKDAFDAEVDKQKKEGTLTKTTVNQKKIPSSKYHIWVL